MSGGPETGRWERRLEEYCRSNGLDTPVFEPCEIGGPKGQELCLLVGRNCYGEQSQWGCYVSVGSRKFSSQLYYDSTNTYTAREEAAKIALEHHESVIPFERDPTVRLRRYMKSGNHDGLRRAIQEGAKVDADPLCTAISRHDFKALHILLEAEPDISHINLLENAVVANTKEIMQILLKYGADANYGEPLRSAVQFGRKDMVEVLLQAGADVNSGDALSLAVEFGDIEILQVLLDAGADANRADILEAAVQRGDIGILHILLGAGPNANHGHAFLNAIYKGREDLVEILLQAGADVNQHPALAVSANRDEELVGTVLEAVTEANILGTDRLYGSPLIAAIMSGKESIVKTLITAGADVNMECTNGGHPSPLVAAIRESNTKEKWPGVSRAARSRIIGLLLESGADVNLQLADDRCRNALDAALEIDDDRIIRRILIAGADLSNTSNGVTMRCPWELPHILLSETEELDVFSVSTFTKTNNGVLLTTCAQYLEISYGVPGIDILEGIMCALKDADRVHVSNDLIFRATSQELIARVPFSMEHLLDAVVWVCLTFRQPPSNGPQISTGALTGGKFIFNPWRPLRDSNIPENTCWSALFDTAVVAFQQSTPLTQEWRLQITYQDMIQLAAVEYPVLVDGGIVLMGYSTALIPVRKSGRRTIEWHLEVAAHDGQFNISELAVTKGSWLKTKHIDDLRVERNLLGWCRNAKVALGTMQGTSDIKRSGARTKHTVWQWTGANLQLVGQSGGPAQVGGQLGLSFSRKMMAVHFSPSDNYLKCLRNSISEQIIIYDTAQKRAWLIPLVCALHQMLLSYAKEHGLLSGVPQTISGNNNGGLASFEVLKDKALSAIDSSSNLELTVRDLIMGFSINLSKAVLQKPSGRKIYGYEFWDIIEDSTQSDLKQQQLERQSLAWAPLLGQIKCLFCSDFGDAIIGNRALCVDSRCNRVPKGLDLMTASMCSIDALLDRHGVGLRGSHESGILAGAPFDQCSHQNPEDTCWKSPTFLQDLRAPGRGSQSPIVTTDTFLDGAVVFGRNKRGLVDLL